MEHTQTEVSRHRHFVAFPLFVLTFAVTTALPLWVNKLPAMLTGSLPSDTAQLTFADGAYGIAYGNTVAEEDEIVKGSAVIASLGMFSLKSDENMLYGFDGAMHVTRSDKGLTVSALTTPVVVTQGNMRMIVPRGMQWSQPSGGTLEALSAGPDAWQAGRVLSRLPSYFVRDKLSDLSRLHSSVSALPDARDTAPGSLPSFTEALLPSAYENAVADWQAKVLGSVRYALEQGNPSAVLLLLENETYTEALGGKEGTSGLMLLLSQVASSDTALQMPLMETLSHNEVAWLLLSYHPDFNDVAWTFDRTDLPRESRLMRLFTLPLSLLTSQDSSDIALNRWKTGWNDVLVAMEDPSIMLRFMISSAEPMIDTLADAGLPERSRALARVVGELLQPFADAHDEVRSVLATLDARTGGVTVSLPQEIVIPESHSSASSVASSSVSSVEELKPEQVTAKAHDVLRAADAVYSLKTSVEAISGFEARIENAIFASSTGDHTVSLTLNVVTGSVHDITINGQTGFPYTPRFESFVAWLKK